MKKEQDTKKKNPKKGKIPKGLGMASPRKIHSLACKILYDGLSDHTRKRTNKLSRRNLDREAPVYGWGRKGEIKPDVAYFTSITRVSDIEASYEAPIFEIEVVRRHGEKKSLNNIKDVLEKVTSIQEAFLFNYETKEWTRYTPENHKGEETDYSSIFEIHLNTLIEKYPYD